MRLDNKMHKWLKFIIKMIPLYFLIFSLFNVLFNETLEFDINSILSNVFSSNNILLSSISELFSAPNGLRFSNFNNSLFVIITGGAYPSNPSYSNAWPLLNNVLYIFEWFLFIDFIDLILGAFRFIINLAHSWLDSFYEKSKRGGK